jgi:hypothetical protein
MNCIYNDGRPIQLLVYEGDSILKVGSSGVTKIEPYYENGEMAEVIWFAVWSGETITARVNGKYVCTVKY